MNGKVVNVPAMTVVKMRTHEERSLVLDPKDMQLAGNFTNEEGEQLLQEAMGKIREMMADSPRHQVGLELTPSPDPMFDTCYRR